MSVTHRDVMEAVGMGYGTDYLNLGSRVEGTEVYVEGFTNSYTALADYVEKVKSVPGVTRVHVDAKVMDGGE